MKPLPTDIVFLAAKRTPFGTYGGSLKDVSATDLAVHAAKAAIAQSGINPEDIDDVVFGNVMQTSSDAIYLARHVGLKAGVPQQVPALTVNRLCGSGFQAVIDAALEILAGHSQCALVGGTESMSQAPHVARGLRFGVSEHLAWSYDWFNVNKNSDKTGPNAGVPYDGNDPKNAGSTACARGRYSVGSTGSRTEVNAAS